MHHGLRWGKGKDVQWEHRNNPPADQIQKTPTKQQPKRRPREGREEIRTEKKSGHDSRNASLKTQNCQSRQFDCVVYRLPQPGEQWASIEMAKAFIDCRLTEAHERR